MKKIACILLLAMLLQLCACKAEPAAPETTKPIIAAPVTAINLTAKLTPQSAQQTQPDASFSVNAANLALTLLQSAYEDGETCVLSPYSVMTALAMSANGAGGQTLAQMQDVLGLSAQECNEYLLACAQNASAEVHSANSLWIHNELTVKDAFLQTLADYYAADVFHAPFDDVTLQEINDWISAHTQERCKDALQQMHPNAILYLINALTFDAAWQTPYDTVSIREGVFYGAQGEEQAEMMSSEEHFYLRDENAVGFMKPYENERYSYVALLPNGGINEYLQSLDAQTLLSLIENAENKTVFAQMPKHTVTTKLELSEVLCDMGMELAFSDKADFSNMTDAECMLSRVLHQTYLSVDGMGTQAGAVTIAEVVTKGAAIGESVTLDRPFLMGIYDHENACFLFLGVINSVS